MHVVAVVTHECLWRNTVFKVLQAFIAANKYSIWLVPAFDTE